MTVIESLPSVVSVVSMISVVVFQTATDSIAIPPDVPLTILADIVDDWVVQTAAT